MPPKQHVDSNKSLSEVYSEEEEKMYDPDTVRKNYETLPPQPQQYMASHKSLSVDTYDEGEEEEEQEQEDDEEQ